MTNQMIIKFHPKEKEQLYDPYGGFGPDPILYHQEKKDGYTVMIYTMYYKKNLAIGLGHTLFPYARMLGYHDVDIEFVAIYQKPGIKKVYFSAHSKEGRFLDWEDCEKENGELVVYIALNSHACYPKAGRYWRYGGFANDVCSSKGRRLNKPTFVYNSVYRKTLVSPP